MNMAWYGQMVSVLSHEQADVYLCAVERGPASMTRVEPLLPSQPNYETLCQCGHKLGWHDRGRYCCTVGACSCGDFIALAGAAEGEGERDG